ncbi:glycosyltransferase [Limosilactobacillus reuteri]|uniref:glycosyltransferase n=1 Tax=Limosilactobacillus reuteri TaxID=1598 RepID=UPI001E4CA104|nr:glycosyltransferase [Limosilactobacillus reuteri]UFK65169.1 Glycosyltransferase GlyD [Limosilactobacillus reuteri]UFK67915.1 Glycosyltransferase GlyD [Limosilactobacillus reuteri]
MHDYVVALAADYGYVTALETTLKSIFYHTPNVHVYLANMDIPPEWFRNINQKLSPVGSQLHDLKIDLNQMAIGKVSWQHINGYSYVRIYLPQLIEAKRILYLDSDVIVRHSLWPLLKFDLQGQPVGMAHEINCAPYNTGVLLIMNDGRQQI